MRVLNDIASAFYNKAPPLRWIQSFAKISLTLQAPFYNIPTFQSQWHNKVSVSAWAQTQSILTGVLSPTNNKKSI